MEKGISAEAIRTAIKIRFICSEMYWFRLSELILDASTGVLEYNLQVVTDAFLLRRRKQKLVL